MTVKAKYESHIPHTTEKSSLEWNQMTQSFSNTWPFLKPTKQPKSVTPTVPLNKPNIKMVFFIHSFRHPNPSVLQAPPGLCRCRHPPRPWPSTAAARPSWGPTSAVPARGGRWVAWMPSGAACRLWQKWTTDFLLKKIAMIWFAVL